MDQHSFTVVRNHVPDEVVDAHFVTRLRIDPGISGNHMRIS